MRLMLLKKILIRNTSEKIISTEVKKKIGSKIMKKRKINCTLSNGGVRAEKKD